MKCLAATSAGNDQYLLPSLPHFLDYTSKRLPLVQFVVVQFVRISKLWYMQFVSTCSVLGASVCYAF